jgi:drug/metabolite transporter (DMT)-like permease
VASQDRATHRTAVALALLAAFLWADYYGFVLLLHGRLSPVALLAEPFLFGGLAYAVWNAWTGHVRLQFQLFASPAQWLRILLFLGNQVAILGLTIAGGSVDAALLSLVGDAGLTPLLVMSFYGEGRDRLLSPLFVGGLLLSAFGAALTILGGGTVVPLRGLYLLLALVIPFAVAGFFVSAARAGRTVPVSAVAGNASLGAGLLALVGIAVVPAEAQGMVAGSPLDWGLVVALGVTSFAIAPALYFAAIARTGIILPALLMAAIPLFTLGIASAIMGSLPPPLALVGVPVAIVGAILAIEGNRGAASTPERESALRALDP